MLTPEPEIASQLLANCLLERIRSRDDCRGSAVCLFDRSLMRTPPPTSSSAALGALLAAVRMLGGGCASGTILRCDDLGFT